MQRVPSNRYPSRALISAKIRLLWAGADVQNNFMVSLSGSLPQQTLLTRTTSTIGYSSMFRHTYLLLQSEPSEPFMALPHLVLDVVESDFQQEASKVDAVAARRPHDFTRAPRIPAHSLSLA